jgi:signal transduction histidine kinase
MVEIGFLVAFGVLLDTFVVRSVLVPALTFGLGRVTWWPGRLSRLGRTIATAPGAVPGATPLTVPVMPPGSAEVGVPAGPAQAAGSAGLVDEERFRIARDLHHVIADNMSAINAHASVAAHLLQTNPRRDDLVLDKLGETMRQVSDAARAGLAELKATAALLRGYDAPNNGVLPSLRNLDELTRPLLSAGAAVRVEVGDDVRLLPIVLDITAYRLVEAALAEPYRSPDVRNVYIGISRDQSCLRITVADDGTTIRTGTTGMAARAGLVGGQLTAARYRDGYRVDAVLPYPAALPHPSDVLG